MQTLALNRPQLTVGPANADVPGFDNVAIQSALLLATSRSVGVVQLAKGTFRLRNSLYLPSGITLRGDPDGGTVLRKALFAQSPLVADANWYQRVVRVRDPDLFPVGGGIRIMGPSGFREDALEVPATVTGKDGNALLLDRSYIGEDFWLAKGEQFVATLFPLIWAEDGRDIVIADLEVDGATALEDITAHAGGGISMQNCDRVTVHNVHSHHHNGDAMDWQICDHVTVERCRLEYSNLGLHPGSGSQHTVVRDCVIRNNLHGFFFCWGVQFGVLENCEMYGNRDYGISIGFHDSHNVVRGNYVHDNGQVGIHLRTGHFPHQSPVDNLIAANRLENNGPANQPLGIRIDAHADCIVLRGNVISETRGAPAGVGIEIAETVGSVALDGNIIHGFRNDVMDLRTPAPTVGPTATGGNAGVDTERTPAGRTA